MAAKRSYAGVAHSLSRPRFASAFVCAVRRPSHLRHSSSSSSSSSSHEFVSTRASGQGLHNGRDSLGFLSAVRQGLATDGGLYVPRGGPPALSRAEWEALLPLSYQERAVSILSRWIPHEELAATEVKKMVAAAYTDFGHCGDKAAVAPVVHLEGDQYILELFHGPTASFKDLALQLTPRLFARAAQGSDMQYLILVATSGDTGSAALEGFGNVDIPTMVLYPTDGVSTIQRAQMTTTPLESTHTIGIDGDFDWCQTAVKTLFNDANFAAELAASYGNTLSAANSMNWGRLLPQVVYHSSAYLDLVTRGVVALGEPVDVCVPTGNFGNILAAVYAKAMGIPFRRFTVAANENNVLADFLKTGAYDLRGRQLSKTISPSIDILTSSNLERMLHLLCLQASGGDANAAGVEVARCFGDLAKERHFQVSDQVLEVLQSEMRGGWATEAESKAAISSTFERTGYLLDPHTAVAKHVIDTVGHEWCGGSDGVPVLISSTAHYGKFASDVVGLVGAPTNHVEDTTPLGMLEQLGKAATQPATHTELIAVVGKDPLHKVVVPADLESVKDEIRAFLGRRRGSAVSREPAASKTECNRYQ